MKFAKSEFGSRSLLHKSSTKSHVLIFRNLLMRTVSPIWRIIYVGCLHARRVQIHVQTPSPHIRHCSPANDCSQQPPVVPKWLQSAGQFRRLRWCNAGHFVAEVAQHESAFRKLAPNKRGAFIHTDINFHLQFRCTILLVGVARHVPLSKQLAEKSLFYLFLDIDNWESQWICARESQMLRTTSRPCGF